MIRFAQEKDIPQMTRLLIQVEHVHALARPDLFQSGERTKYNEDQLVEILHNPQTPILAYTDENDVMLGYAFCIFQQHLDDNVLTPIKTLYIDDLCVEEACRGQHIGKQLYEAVLKYAKESGCYNVTLNVWNGNDSAMKFYQSVGLGVQKVGMEKIL